MAMGNGSSSGASSADRFSRALFDPILGAAARRATMARQGFEGVCNSLWDMQLRRKRLEGVTTVVSTAFSWMRYSSEKAGSTAMHQRSLVSMTFKALAGKPDLPPCRGNGFPAIRRRLTHGR